jgi:hypothetical protein
LASPFDSKEPTLVLKLKIWYNRSYREEGKDMKRLIAVLAVLSIFALSAPVSADEGIDAKKTNQPAVNFTWDGGKCSTSEDKTDEKPEKRENIKKAKKDCVKNPDDYIK